MPADPPGAHILAIAPGRVNLLGEHLDYNDGFVLPAAIDRSVRVSARPNSLGMVTITTQDLNQTVEFDLDNLERKVDLQGKPLPPWAHYMAGVAWSLQQSGLETPGFEALVSSDVPIGAGLSSSAAVQVAFAVLWQALGGWQVSRMELAQMCLRAEIHYVGVNCGLMDQFASANGVAGCALYLDTRSLEWRPVPLPPHAVIVIADSGKQRSLATSAYNARRAACEQAVALLKPYLPAIRALRDVSPDEFARFAHVLPEMVRLRARHVVEECVRVQEAVLALQCGDVDGFGRLMLAGHASLRDLYQVSCPELDALVEIASGLPGCWGARLTGAGFGGCTVNLVEESRAEGFIQSLREGYFSLTNRQAEVYLCRASQGASVQRIIG